MIWFTRVGIRGYKVWCSGATHRPFVCHGKMCHFKSPVQTSGTVISVRVTGLWSSPVFNVVWEGGMTMMAPARLRKLFLETSILVSVLSACPCPFRGFYLVVRALMWFLNFRLCFCFPLASISFRLSCRLRYETHNCTGNIKANKPLLVSRIH